MINPGINLLKPLNVLNTDRKCPICSQILYKEWEGAGMRFRCLNNDYCVAVDGAYQIFWEAFLGEKYCLLVNYRSNTTQLVNRDFMKIIVTINGIIPIDYADPNSLINKILNMRVFI